MNALCHTRDNTDAVLLALYCSWWPLQVREAKSEGRSARAASKTSTKVGKHYLRHLHDLKLSPEGKGHLIDADLICYCRFEEVSYYVHHRPRLQQWTSQIWKYEARISNNINYTPGSSSITSALQFLLVWTSIRLFYYFGFQELDLWWQTVSYQCLFWKTTSDCRMSSWFVCEIPWTVSEDPVHILFFAAYLTCWHVLLKVRFNSPSPENELARRKEMYSSSTSS